MITKKPVLHRYTVLFPAIGGLGRFEPVLASAAKVQVRPDGKYEVLFTCGDDSLRFDGAIAWGNLDSIEPDWNVTRDGNVRKTVREKRPLKRTRSVIGLGSAVGIGLIGAVILFRKGAA